MYPVDASHPKRCRPQLPSDGRTKHLDTPTLTKLPETVSKHPKLWWWFRHTPCAQSTHCYLCCHVCFVKIFEFLLYVLNKELLPSKGIQLSILIAPYDLSCTYVHITDFSLFWREALLCTYVHNNRHIRLASHWLHHAIYGGHDRTQWFRSSPWMVSSWGLHRTFKN